MAEVAQAIGSLSQILYAVEAVWGTVNASPNWRALRVLPGETLDPNVSIFKSKQIRVDRMKNKSVRGNQKPGGTIPFELSPQGWNPFLWHLLGGTVVTTGTSSTGSGATIDVTAVAGAITAVALNAAGTTYPVSSTVTLTIAGGTGGTAAATISAGGIVTAVSLLTPGTGYTTGTAAATTVTKAPYTHVIKGSTSLPTGFTLEKGFTDVSEYIPFYGCRITKGDLSFAQDQIVTGTFDIMARQCDVAAGTSLNMGAAPAVPTDDPYVSAEIAVYEGSGLTLLGVATELKIMLDNALYGDRGFVLGSNLRQNLKPGARGVTSSGKFLFQNANLYNEAINGTASKLRVLAAAGASSIQIDLPSFQFLPPNSSPKITDDGPLDISLTGESIPDPVSGTDIEITIITPEPSITV